MVSHSQKYLCHKPQHTIQPAARTQQRVTNKRLIRWLLIAPIVCTALFALKKWRAYKQKKEFHLLVQKLVNLKQKLQNLETSDPSYEVYKAYKEFLLQPYQKDPTMLKKLETEVAHAMDIDKI